MASIIERPKKDGTSTWQVMVRIPGTPRLVKTLGSEQEAREFARDAESQLRNVQRASMPKKAAVRTLSYLDFQNEQLRDVLSLFLASSAASDRHRRVCKFVIRSVGTVKIGDLRRSWVKEYIAKTRTKKTRVGRQFAWNTIVSQMATVGMAIRWRAEELEVDYKPFPFSKSLLPKNWQTKRNRRLSAGEETALIRKLRNIQSRSRHHWRLLVLLALETAARMQELLLAEWGEFNLATRNWIIPAEHTKCKVERSVPLSNKAFRIVRALKLISSSTSTRLFHTLGSTDSVSSQFHRHTQIAGLVDFKFHDLRHEAISRMVLYKRKMNMFEIMKIVGHTNISMLDRYANLRGDEMVSRMD